MDTKLKDKNVLVTGASGGIGSSTAQLFSEEGANVVIHYHRNDKSAAKVQSGLGDRTQSCILKADLTKESDVQSLFQNAEKELGPVEVLVANAGVWPTPNEPIQEMSLERWNRTIAQNLTSVFLTAREFLTQCQRHQIKDPSIVMIGSTAGFFGEADHGDYATAKSGLMGGLLQSLKNELPKSAPLGRVNVVAPGWTRTPMAEKFVENSEAMYKALQTIPMKKIGNSTDIAKAVVFLASNELAGHITGQTLFVSGGMEGRVLNTLEELKTN